jgi:Tol biopolymer transport system component
LSGSPIPVPEATKIALGARFYNSGLSTAHNGMLLLDNSPGRYQLTWFDRNAHRIDTISEVDRYTALRISPDGTRTLVLSFANSSTNARDLSLVDFARGIRSRLWSSSGATTAIWSRDGRRILYYRGLSTSIFERDASALSQQRVVLESPSELHAYDFSPDGHMLLYSRVEGDGSRSLCVMSYPQSNPASRKPVLYLKNSLPLANAQFSPDGRWVAYSTNTGGRNEIFVQSFPNNETRIQVSNSGGDFPRWRKDGSELFYRATDGQVMTAAVHKTARGLELGTPSSLGITVPIAGGAATYSYDISADGQRILALTPDPSENAALTILTNWRAPLRP